MTEGKKAYQHRKDLGLVPVTLWVAPGDRQKFQLLAQKSRDKFLAAPGKPEARKISRLAKRIEVTEP